MKKISIILSALAFIFCVHTQAQEVKLVPNQLTLVNYFSDRQGSLVGEINLFQVDSLLGISITTESHFNSLKDLQIPHIIVDTANYRKQDGILKLPVGETHIEFKDVDSDNESYENFYYMGQIPFLNSYLILLSGFEYIDYFLIDKTTGKRNEPVFVDYPFISPNKKYIVCIYACPYSIRAEMQVFKIADDKLEFLYSFSFPNWMPTTEHTSLVWVDDNSFVLKAIHPKIFWNEQGDINESGEYIKIEILE